MSVDTSHTVCELFETAPVVLGGCFSGYIDRIEVGTAIALGDVMSNSSSNTNSSIQTLDDAALQEVNGGWGYRGGRSQHHCCCPPPPPHHCGGYGNFDYEGSSKPSEAPTPSEPTQDKSRPWGGRWNKRRWG